MGITYQTWTRPEEFIVLNQDVKNEIMSLTHAEAGVYFKLLIELKHDKTRLELGSQKMTLKDMTSLTNLSRNTVSKHVLSLIKADLIHKTGVSRGTEYHINSEYGYRSTSAKNDSCIRFYVQKAREELSPLRVEEVGVFGKLSLFININTLTLSMFTEAKTIEEASPLKEDDIADIFNQTTASVRSYLKILEEKNLLLTHDWESENKKAQITFLLHPDIVMRGGDDADIYDEASYLFMSEAERTAFVKSLYQIVEGERNQP